MNTPSVTAAAVGAMVALVWASGPVAAIAPPEGNFDKLASNKPGGVSNAIAAGVVKSDGVPAAGAVVTLLAWPSGPQLEKIPEGGKVPIHTVGTDTSDKDGQFSISVDPSSLPAWTKDSGSRVDLELQVADATRLLLFNYSVDAVPSSTRAARGRTWTASAGPSKVRLQRAPRLRLDLGQGTAWDKGNDPANWLDENGREYGPSRRATAAKVSVVERTAAVTSYLGRREECFPTVGPLIANLPEHFLSVYSWTGAPGTVKQSSGVDHTLGVATKAQGGTWSANGTNTESFNASAGQPGIIDSSVWNRVNYRDYGNTCGVVVQRRPVGYADLLSNDWAHVAHATFNGYCSIKPAGGYFATESATNKTYGAGVDLGPISVSAQSGYTSQMDLRFDYKQKTRICGTNSAGLVSSAQLSTSAAP